MSHNVFFQTGSLDVLSELGSSTLPKEIIKLSGGDSGLQGFLLLKEDPASLLRAKKQTRRVTATIEWTNHGIT